MDLTRGIWRWLALVLACTAVHAQEGPAPNADSVLERVNHYRARAGAPPLAVNVKVQAAAQSHAQYMADTRQLSHTQGDRTSAHYTGDSLENRLHRAGVRASASGEVVGLASRPHPQTVVDDLVATVYHRLLLLSHGFTEAGVGLARGTESGLDVVFVTIDLIGGEGADADASVTSVYPAPDQKEVTRDFDPASETPNPMPARELVGQPVSIQAATGRPLVVDRFTLTAHGQDNVVEARVLTRSNDMQMPEWAATLVPLQPL